MAKRAAHICRCGRRVASGMTCPCQAQRLQQLRADTDRARPNANARGYDADWRRVRDAYLEANPLCSEPGCTARAKVVDHVLSVRDRPDLRLEPRNFRGFCKTHHDRRTARDQGFGRGRSSGVTQPMRRF